MPLTNVLKLQLFSPEDARHVRGQRRRPERVAQLGRVSTRFCFISFISDRDGEILVSLHPFFLSGRILRSGEMRLHFTRFLHGFGVGLDRDVLCCPQNIGEAAA